MCRFTVSLLSFLTHINPFLSLLPRLAYKHLPTQTVMVSLEGLSKIVDPSQLTADFEGSLEYNHDEWIEVGILACPLFHCPYTLTF